MNEAPGLVGYDSEFFIICFLHVFGLGQAGAPEICAPREISSETSQQRGAAPPVITTAKRRLIING